ncbi:hypothetical protein FQN57_005508 [Myotisia sp. PD_48]|nr:hypothetical protein FQN57_005508 [Myotisia sp. PD_48]
MDTIYDRFPSRACAWGCHPREVESSAITVELLPYWTGQNRRREDRTDIDTNTDTGVRDGDVDGGIYGIAAVTTGSRRTRENGEKITACCCQPQRPWTFPPGNQKDYSTTLNNGKEYTVGWVGWEKIWIDYYLGADPMNDLWVVSVDQAKSGFGQFIKGPFNISNSGSVSWTADIPTAILQRTNDFHFQFKNQASPQDRFDSSTGSIASPRVFIRGDSSSVSVTTITATGSPSASSSSRSSSESNSPPEPTPPSESASESASESPSAPEITSSPSATPIPPSQRSSLSTAAAAGIGVGSALGLCAIVGLFIFFRRRLRPAPTAATPATTANESAPIPPTSASYFEPQKYPPIPHEMGPGRREPDPIELPGAYGNRI